MNTKFTMNSRENPELRQDLGNFLQAIRIDLGRVGHGFAISHKMGADFQDRDTMNHAPLADIEYCINTLMRYAENGWSNLMADDTADHP